MRHVCTDGTFCCQCDFCFLFLNLGEIADTYLCAFLTLGSTVRIEGRRNKKEFIVCSQGVEVDGGGGGLQQGRVEGSWWVGN